MEISPHITFLHMMLLYIHLIPYEAVITLHANKRIAIDVEGLSRLSFASLWVAIVPMSIPVKTFGVRH